MNAVLRFAPSPNGPLHLGHAYSALLNADLSARLDGRLLLRLDDIDTTRCRPEFAEAILADCDWLGLRYEQPVWRQTDHFAEYRAALATLRDRGLAYPAFVSRGELALTVTEHERAGGTWPRDPDGAPHYPPADRGRSRAEADGMIAAGRPYALRLDMAKAIAAAGRPGWLELSEDDLERGDEVAVDPAIWGDVVLAGRETVASYHLAVVVDDAAQQVTHVVRGEDLRQATAVHRLLQELLGLPAPRYLHHRLIRDEAGTKLSKSTIATGIDALRDGGATPDDIRRLVGLERSAGRVSR